MRIYPDRKGTLGGRALASWGAERGARVLLRSSAVDSWRQIGRLKVTGVLVFFGLFAAGMSSSAVGAGDTTDPIDRSGGLFSLGVSASDEQMELSQKAQRRAQSLSHYYRGLMKERAGRVDEALEAFEKALEFNPQNLRLAGRASELAGQFSYTARGLSILEETLRLNEDDPDAYIILSEYLSTYNDNRRDFIERSVSVMEQAATRFPRAPQVYERLVSLYLMGKDSFRARETLDRAAEQDSKDPEYWLEIGRIAARVYPVREGDVAPQLNAFYEKAYQFGQDNVDIAVRVADFYRVTRQLELARDRYAEIVRRFPGQLDVRRKLAGVYSLLNEEDKVLETLVELERINPHDLDTQKFIAGMYLRQNNFENSIRHYLKAFKISKGTSEEYQRVGWMLRWEDRAQEAIELLEQAIFHYPDDVKLMIELAISFNAAERYEEAFDGFVKAERISEKLRPDLLDDAFYFSFGAAAERKKLFDKAADLFRKSIELAPIESEPHRAAAPYNYLGYMWLEQDKNIEEAGQLIIRANDLVPDSGAYVDSLGWYYFKIEKYPEALETLLRAEQLLKEDDEGEDAVVLDHIAQAYFQLGHRDKALEYARRVIKLEPENEEYQGRLKHFTEAELPQEPVPLDFLDQSEEPSASGERRDEA